MHDDSTKGFLYCWSRLQGSCRQFVIKFSQQLADMAGSIELLLDLAVCFVHINMTCHKGKVS